MGVNLLRETFHHWISTIQLPVKNGTLENPLPHKPAIAFRDAKPVTNLEMKTKAGFIYDDLVPDLKEFIKQHRIKLTEQLKSQLDEDGKTAIKDEEERFLSRQGEVSKLIEDNTIAKIVKEINKLKVQKQQTTLFEGSIDIFDLARIIHTNQRVGIEKGSQV